ncbi:MAG: hypothetical protein GY856_35810 [bacterium]|nr:hypothetical protein [bacterium]
MPVANDTPEEEEYEVMGGGGIQSTTQGCLDAYSIVVAAEQGQGPWQVTFRDDSSLRVTLTDAEDAAVLYKDNEDEFQVKVLEKNTCQLTA